MRRDAILQRMGLLSALVVPALAGLAFLVGFDAPKPYALVNLAALFLASLWIASGGLRCPPHAGPAMCALLVAVMALPLMTGPLVDGVARWVPLGPLALHSGMASVPLLVVLAASDARRAPYPLLGAMIWAALQPDAATASAMTASAMTLAVATRRRALILTAIAGGIATIAAWHIPGPPPQRFVEGVIGDAWAFQPIAAWALILALIWPVIVLARYDRARLPALALAAALVGFAALSLIGPYPVPLLGYGAAPLLGFGLAFAALARFGARETGKGLAR